MGEYNGPVARVAAAGLSRFERLPAQLEKSLERRAVAEQRALRHGLGLLVTVATAAPLLGFLGTVAGMMVSFGALAEFGHSNPKLVAEGIQGALTTTAVGLAVALPAQLMHNALASRMARIEDDMEAVANWLLETRDDFA